MTWAAAVHLCWDRVVVVFWAVAGMLVVRASTRPGWQRIGVLTPAAQPHPACERVATDP